MRKPNANSSRSCPPVCRGRCPHRPGRMHRFYGNLRRICNFSMGRQSCRPLQQPFALSVGADDSVCPRDVPILRESSANSQLPNGAMCASPPTSKEVTACGFAANSRRNSLHSAGRAEPRPYQLRLHFNGFCVKQTVYGLKLMTLGCRGGFGLLIRLERAHRFRKEHWHNKYS